MFFAFKETYKLDSQNSKITDLERKIANLEQKVYFLENPPKFKVGDLVIVNHKNGNYALTEEGEFKVFVIVQISKNKYTDPYASTKYFYTYSIIDKKFKKAMKLVDEEFLKQVNIKERKKKWLLMITSVSVGTPQSLTKNTVKIFPRLFPAKSVVEMLEEDIRVRK